MLRAATCLADCQLWECRRAAPVKLQRPLWAGNVERVHAARTERATASAVGMRATRSSDLNPRIDREVRKADLRGRRSDASGSARRRSNGDAFCSRDWLGIGLCSARFLFRLVTRH